LLNCENCPDVQKVPCMKIKKQSDESPIVFGVHRLLWIPKCQWDKLREELV
jgi:hypothetical protein